MWARPEVRGDSGAREIFTLATNGGYGGALRLCVELLKFSGEAPPCDIRLGDGLLRALFSPCS
jgi:hypothetical protein